MAADVVGSSGARYAASAWHGATPWIASAFFGAVAALAFLHPSRTNGFSIASLVAASNGESRRVEPRLSGKSPWAPFRKSDSGGTDLSKALRTTLAQGDLIPSARHTVGLAQLLAGRDRAALSALSAATESSSGDPRTWSDLAAASYVVAGRYNTPELLADALGAADSALAIDANLPEALFNRALILERLQLRDDAREAWNRYLSNESDSAWLAEAREHLRRVAPLPSFSDTLKRNYEHLVDDPAAVRELVTLQREDARIEGPIEILGQWAAAEARHDRLKADRHLRLARQLGSEIRKIDGDRMLERAVAVIDAAGETSRAELASAQLDYSGGIMTFRDKRPTEAEPMLRRAAAGLARAGSPLALMARYYVANTVFDQGRREEARHILEGVLAETSDEFPGCRAHVLSQLGGCAFARTEWGESMRLLEESAAIFERLGETSNPAAVHRLISIIYDQNGDRERAWKHRMAALSALGSQSNLRLEKAISSIGQDAMVRQNWRTAVAFLNLEIGIARRIDDDVQLVEALLFRAAVCHRLNQPARAQADVAEADAIAVRLKDAGYRAHLQANGLAVRAMLTSSPAEADRLLTDAIAFESARGDRKDVPRLLLQRGRARRAMNDVAGADGDLDRGIAQLEAERGSLPQGEARWGAFHSAGEVFEEAIDLAIERHDIAKAFAIAEKARARSLLEAYDNTGPIDQRLLPPDTLVVEYAVLPTRLVIFTADASGIQAVVTQSDRKALSGLVETLTGAFRSQDGSARHHAAMLWKQLIGPVATELARARNIVFVPDATTSAIPFGALIDDRGEYVLQTHTVVVAPSAAAFAAASSRRARLSRPRSVLVVANSNADADSGALSFVGNEAGGVARQYPVSVQLRDDHAQYDELARQASAADVIHFAGHAIGDDSGLEPASIVLRQSGDQRRIGVPAIATLPLSRTSVVVLAGCSTARGERRGTEGVMSVARGFMIAGAPSVIATLWPIDDAIAARTFPRIHALLARGVPPAEALRIVQIESIQRGDIPPSLWAALQVIGS